MPAAEQPQSPLALSYIALRRAIGIIGVSLPFVLLAGWFLPNGPVIQPSISDYYYTIMGSYFVGSMCAIGVFQLSYRGPDPADRIAPLPSGPPAWHLVLPPNGPLWR